MADTFSYEDIYELLRAERYSTDVQPFKEQDLQKMKNYFENKKALLAKQTAGSEFFDVSKKAKLNTEIENAFRAIKDLYAKREQKIINRALFTTRTDSKMKDTTNMLVTEVKLYEQMIQVLLSGNFKFFQELGIELPEPEFVDVSSRPRTVTPTVTHDVDDGDESKLVKAPGPAVETRHEITAPIIQPAVQQAPAPQQQRQEIDLETQKNMREAAGLLSKIAVANPGAGRAHAPSAPSTAGIRSVATPKPPGTTAPLYSSTASMLANRKQITFLQSVPQFLDENMNKYGPYKAGDKILIPNELADILIKQQKAKGG